MNSNGNYEHLIDQITDMVLAKLDGDEYCPTFCRADVERIVDAGAERIGIVLGETANSILPYPLPPESVVIVIQSALLAAVQPQPAGDVTETVPVPPSPVKD